MTKRRKAPALPADLLRFARLCSPMQRTFAEALVRDPKRNQTRAAKAAGAKDPKVRGCRWAKNRKVRQYMDALVREASMVGAAAHTTNVAAADELVLAPGVRDAVADVKELLERISENARVDMADFLSVRSRGDVEGNPLPPGSNMLPTEVYFDWNKALKLGKTHLIKKITVNKHGYPCITLVDSQAALWTLARIKGLLNPSDRDDPDESASRTAALATLPPETLRQIHRALLAQPSGSRLR